MASTGKSLTPEKVKRLHDLCAKLAETFKTIKIDGNTWFQDERGTQFRPLLFPPPWDSIVLEYDDMEEGDFYPLDEMTDDEIFSAILEEIKL